MEEKNCSYLQENLVFDEQKNNNPSQVHKKSYLVVDTFI